jgi:hypothetical protein
MLKLKKAEKGLKITFLDTIALNPKKKDDKKIFIMIFCVEMLFYYD